MPTVTIDGKTVEVKAGTNLIAAAAQAGVEIPHYCYHPRLSTVGQCRMCLVKLEGVPKLQTACTTEIHKDGMVVLVDDDEVRQAQEGVMEFLLINHPLDCPICDQAGECGLQDYSFAHGQSFSRFDYDAKRTYPGRERIPLGPQVLLNMNRCIQCTRCVRFTEEITGTGELGFFQRGARTEIGVFPGKKLDNPLSVNVVDLCPVGALTSTEFRFAERVWFLDKAKSLCTGCDAGCNISLEHRRGIIRRYKPRFNPHVNDYWLCDFGRGSFSRYSETPRLSSPTRPRDDNGREVCSWDEAMAAAVREIKRSAGTSIAFLAAGELSNEEAYLFARLAGSVGSPHRCTVQETGRKRSVPNPAGGVSGEEPAPNRRGAELAGLRPAEDGFSTRALMEQDAAGSCTVLLVADAGPGSRLHQREVVDNLRRAEVLIVAGWAETPLAAAADIVLPISAHPEKEGTYVNSQGRLQRFDRAYPAPTGARDALEVLSELLAKVGKEEEPSTAREVFARLSESVPAFADLEYRGLPEHGVVPETAGEGQ